MKMQKWFGRKVVVSGVVGTLGLMLPVPVLADTAGMQRSGAANLGRVLRAVEIDQTVLEQFRPDHRYWRQKDARRYPGSAGGAHAQFRPVEQRSYVTYEERYPVTEY